MRFMGQQTRHILVQHGAELLTEFSYNALGIDRLLRETGVSKGSFYHFFGSKQGFALEVIGWYEAYFEERFCRILGDSETPPLQRLAQWMRTGRNRLARHQFRRGCLVGNLSQELGSTDPVLSKKLQAVFRGWESWIADVLAQAKARNDLPADADTESLARIFWIGWQGAILRAKLEGSGKPLDDFSNFFIAYATQGGNFYTEKVR